MPLRDHFHPPLSVQRHWEGLHSKWAAELVDQLNERLPPRYFAEPHIHQGTQIEVDVATFEEDPSSAAGDAAVGTLVWSPGRPTLTVPLEISDFDQFEVQVMSDEAGPQLVAAIELVSPANKDRPGQRHAFAVKCAAYLHQGISLIVADVVTSRSANPHVELFELLRIAADFTEASQLYAAAYRTRRTERVLDSWLEPLRIGGPLPTLPLWLNAFEAVPVDLEESYTTACQSLRIGGS